MKLSSSSEIDKLLTRFIKAPDDKDNPITYIAIDKNNDKKEYAVYLNEFDKNKNNLIIRPMTYLDLLYIAAHEISKEMYSLNTRHPVTNNQNIYAAKINVNSTVYTKNAKIEILNNYDEPFEVYEIKKYPYVNVRKTIDYIIKNIKNTDYDIEEYENYINNNPKLFPKQSTYYDLFRATIIGNSHIKSLGADYDGDMMFFRALFTKEANKEAKDLVWKKTNFFNASGTLTRGIPQIGKDVILSLYQLTKE